MLQTPLIVVLCKSVCILVSFKVPAKPFDNEKGVISNTCVCVCVYFTETKRPIVPASTFTTIVGTQNTPYNQRD